MKYAVKIMLSKDDWIFVTEDTSDNCRDLVPYTFVEKSDAESFAEIWRKKYRDNRFVKVVKYES